jgi:hypothetical protein
MSGADDFDIDDDERHHVIFIGVLQLMNGANYRHESFPFLNIRKILDRHWTGFYRGNNEWIIPNVKLNLADVTKDNSKEVLVKELEKNGIHIFSEIQYTPPATLTT